MWLLIENFENLNALRNSQVPWEIYLTLKWMLNEGVKAITEEIDNPCESMVAKTSIPSEPARSVTSEEGK